MSGILVPERPFVFPRSTVKLACETCHYSFPDKVDLNCRYNPPTAFVMMQRGEPYVTSAHPVVAADDWCGQWAAKGAGKPTTG